MPGISQKARVMNHQNAARVTGRILTMVKKWSCLVYGASYVITLMAQSDPAKVVAVNEVSFAKVFALCRYHKGAR